MNKVYIFTHIPKTAGTTLRYHFQKYLKDQDDFIHYANKGNKIALAQRLRPFKERPPSERNKVKVILGHNVDYLTKQLVVDKEPVEIVFFRSPESWEISRYNQYANSKLLKSELYVSYAKWLEIEKNHSQFDWFLTNYSKVVNLPEQLEMKYRLLTRELDKFEHVYFVEQLDKSLINIFKSLRVPQQMIRQNVTGENRKIDLFHKDKNNLALLKDKCNLENKLYLKIKNKYDHF